MIHYTGYSTVRTAIPMSFVYSTCRFARISWQFSALDIFVLGYLVDLGEWEEKHWQVTVPIRRWLTDNMKHSFCSDADSCLASWAISQNLLNQKIYYFFIEIVGHSESWTIYTKNIISYVVCWNSILILSSILRASFKWCISFKLPHWNILWISFVFISELPDLPYHLFFIL
jgi:hypothetical protein